MDPNSATRSVEIPARSDRGLSGQRFTLGGDELAEPLTLPALGAVPAASVYRRLAVAVGRGVVGGVPAAERPPRPAALARAEYRLEDVGLQPMHRREQLGRRSGLAAQPRSQVSQPHGITARRHQSLLVGHRLAGRRRRGAWCIALQPHPTSGQCRHRPHGQSHQQRPAGPDARHTVVRGHGLDDGMTGIGGCQHRVCADTLTSTTTAGTGARGGGIREEQGSGGGS